MLDLANDIRSLSDFKRNTAEPGPPDAALIPAGTTRCSEVRLFVGGDQEIANRNRCARRSGRGQ